MENQAPQEQGNGQIPPASTAGMATEKREQDGAMIFLSYFGIFALIPLLTVKDSDFIQWHAKQGITLVAVAVAVAIAGMFIGLIPVLGWIIALLIPFVQLGLLVIDIIAMIKAFGGERWRIPVVADLAEKF